MQVLLPSGKKVRVGCRDLRARMGDTHPVACAVAEARGRVSRYNQRAATTIQRHTRGLAAKRNATQRSFARAGGVPTSAPALSTALTHLQSPLEGGVSRVASHASLPERTPSANPVISSAAARILSRFDEPGSNGMPFGGDTLAFAPAPSSVTEQGSTATVREESALAAVVDEIANLHAQLGKLRKQFSEELVRVENLQEAIAQAEAEAAPRVDPEQQARVPEKLRKRHAQLKTLWAKVDGATVAGTSAAVALEQVRGSCRQTSCARAHIDAKCLVPLSIGTTGACTARHMHVGMPRSRPRPRPCEPTACCTSWIHTACPLHAHMPLHARTGHGQQGSPRAGGAPSFDRQRHCRMSEAG